MAKMKGAIVVDTLCGGYERGSLCRLCLVWYRLPRWLYHRVS